MEVPVELSVCPWLDDIVMLGVSVPLSVAAAEPVTLAVRDSEAVCE